MPEIKNLKKTAQRIKRAVKEKENIILYADADLDGTTSLVLLEETIKNMGGNNPFCYFPDREKEGYGLNKEALGFLKEYLPALLIALDCGIGNFDEIKLAKNLGFEIIVIDHHEVLENIPKDAIVVDPKQKNDPYPFKGLTAVGIVYCLCELLLKEKLSGALKQSFLELAALGTLADMMPEENLNQFLIKEGLNSLLFTFRPGLRAILEIATGKEQSPREAAQRLISILNITDVKNHLTTAHSLLTVSLQEKAKNLAKEVFSKYQQRRLEIQKMYQEVEGRVDSEKKEEGILFAASPDWPQVLTGTVASRICRRYKKPTFIVKIGQKISRGSVRAPKGFDSVAALHGCGHLLEMYGGHPPASGFSVKNENIEKFRECLLKNF